MDNFLEVRGLTKKYPKFTLNDIGFTLPKGYIMGLIGPNGSGKTTTVKLITGMISRDKGSVKIMALDNIKDERKIKSMVGVVFDSNFFCAEWRVSEVERSVAPFYKNFDSRKYSQLLERFGISPKKHISELSKGMQMKLSLAFAFSYDPKLLILDEPTSGLDPVSRDELLGMLSEYIEDGEHSVLFSTHITADLQKAADFITYINRGELFYTGRTDEFMEMFRIVRGGREELTDKMRERLIGIRVYSTGFEALARSCDLHLFPGLACEYASIDDVIVFVSRKEEN